MPTTVSRLTIYNGALAAVGERRLLTLTENRRSRRDLDDVWDRGGVRTCLAAGLWKFAKRTAQLNYDPDFTPSFGYQKVFDLPVDWVRWMMVCEDEYFNVPLIKYSSENGHLYCDYEIIY